MIDREGACSFEVGCCVCVRVWRVASCVFAWRWTDGSVTECGTRFPIGFVRLYSCLEVLRLPWSSSIIVLYVLEVVCVIFTKCNHMSSPINASPTLCAFVRFRFACHWSTIQRGSRCVQSTLALLNICLSSFGNPVNCSRKLMVSFVGWGSYDVSSNRLHGW